MREILLPDFTLRYHKHSVTALQFIELPLRHAAPILLSGDANGLLVFWDVITRRSITSYDLGSDVPVVALQYLGDELLSILTKDHKLRLLQIYSEGEPIVQPNEKSKLFQLRQVYEIPINTLNFANFIIQKLGDQLYRLVCCNTQDSESIDIYTFHLSDLHSLKRIHRSLNFYEMLKALPCTSDVIKSEKLGIVMKFAECNGIIYCAMENGFVIGFRLHDQVKLLPSQITVSPDNSNGKTLSKTDGKDYNLKDIVEVVYVSRVHYPNPILDLCTNSSRDGNILSSSIDNVIGLHSVLNSENAALTKEYDYILGASQNIIARRGLKVSTQNSKTVPASKVGHLVQLENLLLMSTWSGQTLILEPNDIILAKYSKSKCNLLSNESPQGNIQESNESTKKDKRWCRVSSLAGSSRGVRRHELQLQSIAASSPGQRRRIEKFLQNSWCAIGYDDGSIALHMLNSKTDESPTRNAIL